PHEVGVRRPVQARGEAPPATLLRGAQRGDVLPGLVPFRGEDQDRLAAREVPAEDAGRGQVLDVIESAVALLRVEEVAVPVRLMRVRAVRARDDGRQSG